LLGVGELDALGNESASDLVVTSASKSLHASANDTVELIIVIVDPVISRRAKLGVKAF
jgi:hypothetical protein